MIEGPIAPQLATLVREPPRGEAWLFEIKYDGYRALAIKRGKHVELVSRRGLRYGGMSVVREALAALRCGDAIFDGEICALDAEGRPRFERLQAALGADDDALVYFVFDLLWLRGRDLRALPLEERKRALCTVLTHVETGAVRRAPWRRGDGAAFLEATRQLGLEGLVAKRADRPYRSGRSLDWQKVKTEARQEMVIVGFTPPGTRNRRGLGALLLGVNDARGQLHYAGRVGTGFDELTLDALARRLLPSVVDEAPVVDAPRMRGARWVRPELVAEVRFAEWTREGRLRHPVYVALRLDKRPRDVVRELPAPVLADEARGHRGTRRTPIGPLFSAPREGTRSARPAGHRGHPRRRRHARRAPRHRRMVPARVHGGVARDVPVR